MKKNITFASLVCLTGALVLLRCSTEDTYTINTNPALPYVYPFGVCEGQGARGVSNSGDPSLIMLGMSPDTIANILGAPVDTVIGLFIYKRRGITFKIKYVNKYEYDYAKYAKYINNAATNIEIDCDRWVSIDGNGNWLVGYNSTRDEMTAKYGPPERDEGDMTYWYDSRGVGFTYDLSNPPRLKKIVIYIPDIAFLVNIAQLYSNRLVDNDGDGYKSSFRLNITLGMPDSTRYYVWLKFYSRIHGTTSWGTPFFTVERYIDTLNANKRLYAPITGTDSQHVDYLVELYSRSTSFLLDTMTLQDIPIEAKSRDVPPGMRFISSGTFQMGSNQDVLQQPVHDVTVSSFYMDTTEVTQADYLALMGVNPSYFTGDPRRPVESVTWFDAVLYCNARSRRDGKDTVYGFTGITGTPGDSCSDLSNLVIDFSKNGYRLPTEAEWEYACRAGTTTDYYWNRSYPPTTLADTLKIDSNAVWLHNCDSIIPVQPVAGKKPNAWGLYDMAGNVGEWCSDWFGYYTSGSQTDPTGPSTYGMYRVRIQRGGSWYSGDDELYSAYRSLWYPDRNFLLIGFRVVLPAR
jgi:formylglycine-generating enzyme required for sulfatase activity